MNQNQTFENTYIRHTCTSAFRSTYKNEEDKNRWPRGQK